MHISPKAQQKPGWKADDTTWMLGLYGTAIGAGVLFLPINAGLGGLFPVLVMLICAWPMAFLSHRALCRFILTGTKPDSNITDVVEEHLGPLWGYGVTLLYFAAICPIVLTYAVGITNTTLTFLEHQLHVAPPSRVLVSFILVAVIMSIVQLGEKTIVKAMSLLVFPLIAVLILVSLYLIPHWSTDIFHSGATVGLQRSLVTLWVTIPVMVFAFNFSPIVSSFAVAQKRAYGDFAEYKSSLILKRSTLIMVVTVMLFVCSCVLSLSATDLLEAKKENISILSYLANHFQSPVISWLAPLVAFTAICKSFLGHYLGAREGLHGLVRKTVRSREISTHLLDRAAFVLFFLMAWISASLNPSILRIVEMIEGPILAMILFLLPVYVIHKVEALRPYRGKASNIFLAIIGIITVSAIFYGYFI